MEQKLKIVHVPQYSSSDPCGDIKKKLRELANEMTLNPDSRLMLDEAIYEICLEAVDAIANLQHELEGYERGLKKDE